jgi:putative transposase
MYQKPQVLDKKTHAALRYTPQNGYAFARNLTTVPLLAGEIELAAAHYPTVFSAQGEPTLLAVLGLAEQNVYLTAADRWTAEYIPAFIRRYPFVLANDGKSEKGADTEQYYLAVDTAAPHFQSDKGEPLILENGELGAPSVSALAFLKTFQEGLMVTHAALKEFESTGILVAKTLTVKDFDATKTIGGFRVIDADKVKALTDDVLAKWARNGMLAMIHAHWSSLRHLNKVAIASGQPDKTN